MRTWRITLVAAGLALGLVGAGLLLTGVDLGTLALLALWLVGAVVIHDGLVSPLVIGVGWVLHHTVPARARRYLQGGLVAAALITVVAVPMIAQQGAQLASKALLQQNFGSNLALLVGLVAAVSLLLYAVRVARDARRRPDPVR